MSIIDRIKEGEFTRIIICSGAGVSTGAGIPDYRSDTGIFQMLSGLYEEITEPSDVFSRWFRDLHPEFVEQHQYMSFLLEIEQAEPTPSHHLAAWLNEQGWLKRVYTQNIDGLYQKAGLPEVKLVEFHGNLNTDVVLYGDNIPDQCLQTLKSDHRDILHGGTSGCDLMLVMGTSLQVAPFCAIPNMVSRICTRCYVDLNPSFSNEYSTVGIGMYASGPAPVTKFYQQVSLKPQWLHQGSTKYKEEHILEQDCSVFSAAIHD